jgi:hypothetical protein
MASEELLRILSVHKLLAIRAITDVGDKAAVWVGMVQLLLGQGA